MPIIIVLVQEISFTKDFDIIKNRKLSQTILKDTPAEMKVSMLTIITMT